MTTYKFSKIDFTDREWYDIQSATEDYPEFCDMFDRNGEICEEYEDSWNVLTYTLAHDSIRISEIQVLIVFLADNLDTGGNISRELLQYVLRYVDDFKNQNWEFKGDGDELGFIIDVWDEEYEECTDTTQIWFEDY